LAIGETEGASGKKREKIKIETYRNISVIMSNHEASNCREETSTRGEEGERTGTPAT
jgi:hypothetical protein